MLKYHFQIFLSNFLRFEFQNEKAIGIYPWFSDFPVFEDRFLRFHFWSQNKVSFTVQLTDYDQP
jgi:hypothetical protein